MIRSFLDLSRRAWCKVRCCESLVGIFCPEHVPDCFETQRAGIIASSLGGVVSMMACASVLLHFMLYFCANFRHSLPTTAVGMEAVHVLPFAELDGRGLRSFFGKVSHVVVIKGAHMLDKHLQPHQRRARRSSCCSGKLATASVRRAASSDNHLGP